MKESRLQITHILRHMVLAYGNFLFRYRNFVFPVFLVGLLAAFPPVFALNDARADLWIDLVGLMIGFSGIILRGVVVGLAYIKRGGVQKKVYANNLVTEGMFAHCRNPLYVANLLVLLGIFVIVNNVWAFGLGGFFYLLSYFSIVFAEENYLLDKFGEKYVEYCRRVPRWWIDLSGLRSTFSQFHFNWHRVIVKEYASISTWLLMNLAVFAEEEFINEGFDHSKLEIIYAGCGVILVSLITLAVRALKKSDFFEGKSA